MNSDIILVSFIDALFLLERLVDVLDLVAQACFLFFLKLIVFLSIALLIIA